MRLVKLVGEHTIDVDLLPEEPLVLDAGCRTFNFCDEIFQLRPKAKVIAVDPGPDIKKPSDSRITFFQLALTNILKTTVWLKMAGCESITSPTPQSGWAMVLTISFYGILAYAGPKRYFDLIKFDIEGSEFLILENWPGPCAGQINIEFHDNRYSQDGTGLPKSYFDMLFEKKLPNYRVIQNEPDSCGTHADALLVLNSSI